MIERAKNEAKKIIMANKNLTNQNGKERRVIGNRDIIGNRDRHDLMLETLPAMLKLENLPV